MTALIASTVLMILSPALIVAALIVAADRWAARRWDQ